VSPRGVRSKDAGVCGFAGGGGDGGSWRPWSWVGFGGTEIEALTPLLTNRASSHRRGRRCLHLVRGRPRKCAVEGEALPVWLLNVRI